MIVAIDGPAGAGKSTAALAVARELGFAGLDSGAMYRAVALASLDDPSRSPAEHAATLDLELSDRVLLDGRDVTEAIRSPGGLRARVRGRGDPGRSRRPRRASARARPPRDWVIEGRDIGTVVAPDAEVKVFLTASEAARAARRAREQQGDPARVLAAQRDRDARDRRRAHSPLEPAPDAVVLDIDRALTRRGRRTHRCAHPP